MQPHEICQILDTAVRIAWLPMSAFTLGGLVFATFCLTRQ